MDECTTRRAAVDTRGVTPLLHTYMKASVTPQRPSWEIAQFPYFVILLSTGGEISS